MCPSLCHIYGGHARHSCSNLCEITTVQIKVFLPVWGIQLWYYFFPETAERWWYKTIMGISCFGTKFHWFWRGKASQEFTLPAEGMRMGQMAAPPKALWPWNGSISKGLRAAEAHLQSSQQIPSTDEFCFTVSPPLFMWQFSLKSHSTFFSTGNIISGFFFSPCLGLWFPKDS